MRLELCEFSREMICIVLELDAGCRQKCSTTALHHCTPLCPSPDLGVFSQAHYVLAAYRCKWRKLIELYKSPSSSSSFHRFLSWPISPPHQCQGEHSKPKAKWLELMISTHLTWADIQYSLLWWGWGAIKVDKRKGSTAECRGGHPVRCSSSHLWLFTQL